jgi:hypothetical protein
LEEAKVGKRAVFFVDAAHFVLGAYLGFLWCFERLFVKTGAGRQRFNVLAALNAVTHELITVTNETYINAQSVCELLHKLAALGLSIVHHPGVGQCSVSKACGGDGVGSNFEHRTALPDGVFSQFESH